jgi:hypothetical protein
LYEAALAFLVTYLPLWLHEVEHGDAIAVRDHFECIVPGCTNRCGSPHHLRFRSQGGPDDAWNLAFLCHTHHLELLHQRGLIRVHGRAPDDLVFELGVRPDGTVVEVFVNEERVWKVIFYRWSGEPQERRGALIIDDEPDTSTYLATLLSDDGWATRTTSSVEDGLARETVDRQHIDDDTTHVRARVRVNDRRERHVACRRRQSHRTCGMGNATNVRIPSPRRHP